LNFTNFARYNGFVSLIYFRYTAQTGELFSQKLKMKVKIKRIDKSLLLPIYETAGSCGFDLLARVKTIIAPKELAMVPCNVIVETPPGYMLLISSRSSLPRKKGLLSPHGIGVIDQDYCGPEDEILYLCYNFGKKKAIIEKGEKIAQGIFVKIGKATWQEISKAASSTRGGFGSTDKGRFTSVG